MNAWLRHLWRTVHLGTDMVPYILPEDWLVTPDDAPEDVKREEALYDTYMTAKHGARKAAKE